jgi:broad specificity phosphatase PhoE
MNHPHIDISALTHRVDLYFIRHGETLGNRNHIIQGRKDYPLTETGITHAHAAGAWFSKQKIRRIYTSPLGRAAETARIIAGEIGKAEEKIVPWEDLQEIETGTFTDQSIAKIRTRDPEAWKAFSRNSWEAVPGAETIAQLEARALRVWNSLINTASSLGEPSRLLCVSHGGFIQWLFRVSLASAWDSWMPVIRVGNCGIFHFTIQPAPQDADPLSSHSRLDSAVDPPSLPTSIQPLAAVTPKSAVGIPFGDLPASDGASTGFYAEWKRINFIPY